MNRAVLGMFGLVSLLVGAAVIVYVFAKTQIPIAKAGKSAQEQVQPIAGYGKDGGAAMDSFTSTVGRMKGSALASLKVTSITPGGAMDTYYGLQPGDEITDVGELSLESLAQDEDSAKAHVVQMGFQQQRPLKVRRNGQVVELKFDTDAKQGSAAPAGAAPVAQTPTAQQPTATTPPPQQQPPAQPAKRTQKPKGLSGQLQDIQNAAGGGQQENP
jgi:hypothetical protein